WAVAGLAGATCDRTLRRRLTGPPRPAALRGECPPASACGGCLLLYFAPKGRRPRRAADRRLAGKPGFPLCASGARRESRNAGSECPWCEIKEEASANGRRRGTFAPRAFAPGAPSNTGAPFFKLEEKPRMSLSGMTRPSRRRGTLRLLAEEMSCRTCSNFRSPG